MVLLRLKFQPPPASLKPTEVVLDFVRFPGVKVSVKDNEMPTEKKHSSRARIFATKASFY